METSHLICRANQMTGFYMKCNTELTWVNLFPLVSNVRSTKSNYRVHCQRQRFGGICFGNLTNFTITKNNAATKQEIRNIANLYPRTCKDGFWEIKLLLLFKWLWSCKIFEKFNEKILRNFRIFAFFGTKIFHSLKIQIVLFTQFLMPVIRYNFRKT